MRARKEMESCTNAIHTNLNLRAHDLVPAVYAPYQPPATLEAAGAAERVSKGGRGCEVLLNGFALGGGRGLRQEVDYLGNLCFCCLGQ